MFSLVAMNQHRVMLGVAEDGEGEGEVVEGDDFLGLLVGSDVDLEVGDGVLLHERNVLLGVWSGDKREYCLQSKGGQMIKIPRHGEAAPVDAWTDFAEVDEGTDARRRRSTFFVSPRTLGDIRLVDHFHDAVDLLTCRVVHCLWMDGGNAL